MVALVVPNKKHLTAAAQKMGVASDDWQVLCTNQALSKEVLDSMLKAAKTGLEWFYFLSLLALHLKQKTVN